MDNVKPQIMQMLISSATVENACGVISAADNVLIPPAPLLPAPPGSHNAGQPITDNRSHGAGVSQTSGQGDDTSLEIPTLAAGERSHWR